ncbi:MAG: SAM-dependent methyltransferase [Lewinella sp.]|nr:SAM-dependent methyltransferase [Lewinella sp.]
MVQRYKENPNYSYLGPMEAAINFLTVFRDSLAAGSFVKLTLSKPSGGGEGPQNVFARLVEIRGAPVVSFTLRYPTKDETKNLPAEAAAAAVGRWLGQDFLNADLFTLNGNYTIRYNRKRIPKLFSSGATLSNAPEKTHDRKKQRLIRPEGNIYLQALGIAGPDGAVKKDGQKKFRQINKYIEIIDALIRKKNLPHEPIIVDMGAGKGYLTFALYDHLANNLGLKPQVWGVELRPALVDAGNDLAQKCGFEGLRFVAEDIGRFETGKLDMLIALHACDTATDLAIAKGIHSDAEIIVVAPCCHKQIRRQMDCQTEMSPIMAHGILAERQAELITDGIRALVLEEKGYSSNVFEFIETEHTPKNLIIAGIKGKSRPEAAEEIKAIKQQFGIDFHYLETLV